MKHILIALISFSLSIGIFNPVSNVYKLNNSAQISIESQVEESITEITSLDSQLVKLISQESNLDEPNTLDADLSDIVDIELLSENVNWTSEITVYSHEGVDYEIVTLNAAAKNDYSYLLESGNKFINSTDNWGSRFMNSLGNFISDLFQGLRNSVVKTSIAMLKEPSELDAAYEGEIAYSYAHVNETSFKYVKELGQENSEHKLAYVSSKGTTSIGFQIPEIVSIDGEDIPRIHQGHRQIESIPEGYNSDEEAVEAYNSWRGRKSVHVHSVLLTGSESKLTSFIYPKQYNSPFDIE